MKIELIIPPVVCPTLVYPSVPCLTAFLRQRGFEVVQRDVNAMAFNDFLTAPYIAACLKKIETRHASIPHHQDENHSRQAFERSLMVGEYVLSAVEAAKDQFRNSSSFYDFDKYRRNRRILDAALELISNAYTPSKLTFYDFEMMYDLHSVTEVVESLHNRDENMFIEYFEHSILPLIAQDRPSLVGISIGFSMQLMPGLTLARLIKEELPDMHVTLGGWYITTSGEELIQYAETFKAFDSLVFHEGETAVEELAHRLQEGTSIEEVPNIAFSDGSRVYLPDSIYTERACHLPFPDFADLELDLLFNPKPIFSIPVTRGCYWRRCTFCCENSYGMRYGPMDVETLIDGVVRMQQGYPAPLFYLACSALPPSLADSFAAALVERDLEIAWSTFLRLENAFTPELFKKMAKARCKMAMFGLESGCQRILDLMDKGFDVKASEAIIQASSKAGIWNHLTLIIGFPTESRTEAEETLAYLIRNKKHIHSIAAHIFALEKGSRLVRERGRFPFVEVDEGSAGLSTLLRFRANSGMTLPEQQDMRRQFYERMREEIPYWDRRESLLLGHELAYIARFGRDFCPP